MGKSYRREREGEAAAGRERDIWEFATAPHYWRGSPYLVAQKLSTSVEMLKTSSMYLAFIMKVGGDSSHRRKFAFVSWILEHTVSRHGWWNKLGSRSRS